MQKTRTMNQKLTARITRLRGRAERLYELADRKRREHQRTANKPTGPQEDWHIRDVYDYVSICFDELSEADRKRYAQYLIETQEPEHGLFLDRYGDVVYSAKAHNLLKKLGDYTPKYPLAVCNDPSQISSGASESMGPAAFGQWLDDKRDNNNAYRAGSLIGHFVYPHCLNLAERGESVEDSPYVQEYRRWLIERQGENGLWNRPEQPDAQGWNGLLKMKAGLRASNTPVPNPEWIIRTILANRDDGRGNFGAGQCTNYNACLLLSSLSMENAWAFRDEILAAFEWYATCIEARHDAETGYFWENHVWPGEGEPNYTGTWSACQEAMWVRNYCTEVLAA